MATPSGAARGAGRARFAASGDGDADDFPPLPPDELEAIRRRNRPPAERRRADDADARAASELEETDRAELGARQQEGRMLSGSPNLGVVSDGAGFLLGLIGWALVLNYLRGGMPAVKGWLAAKFLNRPYTAAAPAPPAKPAAPSPSRGSIDVPPPGWAPGQTMPEQTA